MNELLDEIYLSCFRVDWFASQWHYTSICFPFGFMLYGVVYGRRPAWFYYHKKMQIALYSYILPCFLEITK